MLNDIKYVLIPGKPFQTECPISLYRQLKSHWVEFWSQEYNSYGSHSNLDPMNFYRQDKYTVILEGNTVVATQSLTYFDLRYGYDDFFYFNEMHSKETLQILMSRGLNRILVQQYFMVNQDYSARRTGLNWSAVMAMLSLKNHEGFDGTLTAARTEVAAGSLAIKLGYEKISDNHLVHNVPVASYFCQNPLPYRRTQENTLTDMLWNSRLDFTNTWSCLLYTSRCV